MDISSSVVEVLTFQDQDSAVKFSGTKVHNSEDCAVDEHELTLLPDVSFQLCPADDVKKVTEAFPSARSVNKNPESTTTSEELHRSGSSRFSFFRRNKSSGTLRLTAADRRAATVGAAVASSGQDGAAIVGHPFTIFAPLIAEGPAVGGPYPQLDELQRMLHYESKSRIKKFIRRHHWPLCHRVRSRLWQEICQDVSDAEVQKTTFHDVCVKFEKSFQACYMPVILASRHNIANHFQLNSEGVSTLKRLLTVIEHVRPDFAIIPVLYPLAAIFLHYMSDEDAFACIMRLLSYSQKFLIQSDIGIAASKRTLLVLIKRHARSSYAFLKTLSNVQDDKDLVIVFDSWHEWIFKALPLMHVVRTVDCFMYEGQKVFFRVAVAVIQLWYKEKHKQFKDKRLITKDIGKSIMEFCQSINVDAQKLLKVAFGVRNLKMSYIIKLQQKYELNLRRGDSNLTELMSSHNLKSLLGTHHYIETRLPSKILDRLQGVEMIKHIPTRFQLNHFKLLFCTNDDGISFNRLWSQLADHEPTIILINTSADEIFGAYCSEAWSKRRTPQHLCNFGTGETMVFRFTPHFQCFAWVGLTKQIVGRQEELFQTADATTLIVGGGAIAIRNSLETGTSDYSATFDSPPFSQSSDFAISSLEVFGLVGEDGA